MKQLQSYKDKQDTQVTVVELLAVQRVHAAPAIYPGNEKVKTPTISQDSGPVFRTDVEGPAGAHRWSQVPRHLRRPL